MVTRSFSSARSSLLTSVALTMTALPCLTAQARNTLPDGPAVGATVDRFSYEGEGITALSFRFSALHARTLASEIGISLFPDALEAGALYLAPDLGAAFNASGPGVTVLVKGGLSALTVLGRSFSLIPGYHFGGGLIVQATKRFGIRLDFAKHIYLAGDQSSEPLWSVGVGFTSLGRKAAPGELPPAPQLDSMAVLR
jgi:hypothetical protein